MANKWQIDLDVTEDEVDLLIAILEFAPRWPFAPVDEIDNLKAKVEQAWREREVEIYESPLVAVSSERWNSAGGGL